MGIATPKKTNPSQKFANFCDFNYGRGDQEDQEDQEDQDDLHSKETNPSQK